jgi:transposase InsO family protein
MSERWEFLRFAQLPGANLSELCRRFGISRKTGYKWLQRAAEGEMRELSRRPHHSPALTAQAVVDRVIELRHGHPAWGGRKLHHVLRREGSEPLPAPSTVNSILKRNGLLSEDRRLQRDWQRFEEERPNALWQMDFKGPVKTQAGQGSALTILDDHSRFNLCLVLCPDQRMETVQTQLIRVFERYGLPERLLSDNGPPWGSAGQTPTASVTRLGAWLIRNGISLSHGRPYHPQTQGKEERFHRTLGLEVLASKPVWEDAVQLQRAFDNWRPVYNFQRPHEALGHEPPASRYQPSPRTYRAVLPPIEYFEGDEVRKVQSTGVISFRGRELVVSRGLRGEPVALRATADGVWDVYYCHQRIGLLDLHLAPDV